MCLRRLTHGVLGLLGAIAMICASFAPSSSGAAPSAGASIEVDVARRGDPVSRWLFGKFTEHLGANVYQGAWAQIVPNPEFAPASRWQDAGALRRRLERLQAETGADGLASVDASAFAPYWQPIGRVAGRVLRDADRDMQHLEAGEGGGDLRTPVYLPLGRVRTYDLTLKARLAAAPAAGAPSSVRVALVAADGTVLAETEVALAREWRESKARLSVPAAAAFARGDAQRLAVRLAAGAAADLGRILLFPSDHVGGWDPEVVACMREARLPLLRFPGGNFASTYHWRDAVGPLDGRPVLANRAWPDILEFNHVGTDEWLSLCEAVGATPFICINAGSGTPEEARDWVRYCNAPADDPLGRLRAANGHPAPHNVRLWEIGNELWGSWQEGHTDAAGYAERYVPFYDAMRSAGGDLHLIANGFDEPWNAALVKKAGAKVESLSMHHLPGHGLAKDLDPDEVFRWLMGFSAHFLDEIAPVYRPMVQAGLAPRVAVTELQIFTQHPNLPSNRTQTEAVWVADIINAAIQSEGRVEMITHSALLNHGGGLRKQRGVVWANPVWWTTHLYGTQDGVIPVAVRVDAPAYDVPERWGFHGGRTACLGAAALLAPVGDACTLFVVNRSPHDAFETAVAVRGFAAAPQAEVVTLAGTDYMAANTLEAPDRVRPAASRADVRDGRLRFTSPPASLVRIILKRR